MCNETLLYKVIYGIKTLKREQHSDKIFSYTIRFDRHEHRSLIHNFSFCFRKLLPLTFAGNMSACDVVGTLCILKMSGMFCIFLFGFE